MLRVAVAGALSSVSAGAFDARAARQTVSQWAEPGGAHPARIGVAWQRGDLTQGQREADHRARGRRSLLAVLDSWPDDLGEDEQMPPIDDPPPEPVDL